MQNYAHEASQKIIKHKQLMDPSNSSKKKTPTPKKKSRRGCLMWTIGILRNVEFNLR